MSEKRVPVRQYTRIQFQSVRRRGEMHPAVVCYAALVSGTRVGLKWIASAPAPPALFVICPKNDHPAVLDIDGHLAIEQYSREVERCNYDCLFHLKSPPEPGEASLARGTLVIVDRTLQLSSIGCCDFAPLCMGPGLLKACPST